MSELRWMADLETSEGIVRAEFTTDGELACTDRRIMEALDVALASGTAWVRPINSVLGIAEVRLDDPEAMAAFVLGVLLEADPDLGDVTFYGARYVHELGEGQERASTDPESPNFAYDTIDDEVLRSPDHPESRFGFTWPR